MKKLITIVLFCLLYFSFSVFVNATDEETLNIANKLYQQGLLSGTGVDSEGHPQFGLDSFLTRQQAATLLVKLMGAEDDAISGTWDNQFTDVDNWAKPYVGYAYAHNITSGIKSDYFGANTNITASQYITFILKSLGYSAVNDFSWERSWEFSDLLGLTSGEYNASNNDSFLRADAIKITYATMLLKEKLNSESPEKPLDESTIENVLLTNDQVNGTSTIEQGIDVSNADPSQDSTNIQEYEGDPALVAFAKEYLGYPYVTGGKGPSGFDCSGFCIYCLKGCGYTFTAGCSQDLYTITERIDESDLKPGDLVFFKGTYATDNVSHSGIYIGNGQMIHAGTSNTGVCIVSLSVNYWANHFYAYGRMKKQ